MKSAIYPGTFDPITHGHVDIIARAAKLFDHLIVAIAPTARKSPFLSLDERLTLVKATVEKYSNVTVKPLLGLAVDFAVAENAVCMIRGLRAVSDMDYEFQLAGMNRQLNANIETLFLPASETISATIVREIFELDGDISLFVPDPVVQYLKRKK